MILRQSLPVWTREKCRTAPDRSVAYRTRAMRKGEPPMPFQVAWIETDTPGEELLVAPHRAEEADLSDALRQACELLRQGKAVLTVMRPNGTKLDETQIRDHCSGRRTIIS